MPSGVYERKNAVAVRLKAGLAAPFVEDFTAWLRSRRYAECTITESIRLLACWTHWARVEGYTLGTIRDAHGASLALIQSGHCRCFLGDIGQDSVGMAKLFIRYLEDRQLLPRLPVKPVRALVAEYTTWAREQRGIAETTLANRLWIITVFVENLGDDPAAYDAEAIRAFMIERAKGVSVGRVKSIGVAIRSFLRFLIAMGRCPVGLDHAMPDAANWRLATIPRFIAGDDVERVIAACAGEERLRDRAIVLLLARLGMRASEVAGLTFGDIDWAGGRIRLLGKSRREDYLPLTQEVGDAILAYIKQARSKLASDRLFLTACAPLRPVGRIAIKCLVRRALGRTGVESACKGAHVLRHSAATAMLRHGVSLGGVGAVLRHRSPAMTAHYAKVDIALLLSIAQPWPGRLPC
jgi:integrase/recombinase XerD